MGSIERNIAILTILLKKYRPLTYQDIQEEILKDYDEEIDWRTIKAHVNALSRMFDIIRKDSKGRTYIKPGFGGKSIQFVIRSALMKSTEKNKMAA